MKVEHHNNTISFLTPTGEVAFVFGLPNIRFAPTKKTFSLKPDIEWKASESEIVVAIPDSVSFPATIHFGLSLSVPLELAQSLFYGEDEEIEEPKPAKKGVKFGVCILSNLLRFINRCFSSLSHHSRSLVPLSISRRDFPSYCMATQT